MILDDIKMTLADIKCFGFVNQAAVWSSNLPKCKNHRLARWTIQTKFSGLSVWFTVCIEILKWGQGMMMMMMMMMTMMTMTMTMVLVCHPSSDFWFKQKSEYQHQSSIIQLHKYDDDYSQRLKHVSENLTTVAFDHSSPKVDQFINLMRMLQILLRSVGFW